MSTLVTGASGFIGYHLVKALVARGEEVVCLVRKTSQTARLEQTKARLAFGDVTDYPSVAAAVQGVTRVFHLAGQVLAMTGQKMYDVNEGGFRNLARACAEQANPPVAVFVSSLSAAGPSNVGSPRTEALPPSPVSHYGRSKRAGEMAAEQFAGRAPITIVRPPIVFGEGDAVSATLFRTIKRFHRHIAPGPKRWEYSFVHAIELCEALILAAERGKRLPPPGDSSVPAGQGYYFAAAWERLGYGEFGRLIGAALGLRRTIVRHVPLAVTWCSAAVTEGIGRLIGKPLYLSLDKAHEVAAGSWTCSTKKAAEELGFRPIVAIETRLNQTADWYKQQGWI